MSTSNNGAPTIMKESNVAAAVKAGTDAANIDNRFSYLVEDPSEEDIPVFLLNRDQQIVVGTEWQRAHDERASTPRRRRGTACHAEIASFVEHVNRYKGANAVIWADLGKVKVTAVFNYHPPTSEPSDAGWGDHRAVYECPRSPQWKAWTSKTGEAMRQEAFADWLDEHAEDLADVQGMPKAIDLLTLARNLNIYTKGTFERRIDPTTGNHSLVCKQESESNSTPIPKAFVLGIPVFEGGELYRVEARIRFGVRDGVALFQYDLHQREIIERAAFGDVRKVVAEKTALPVFAGTPES